jgi:hypothetical protein
VCAANCVALIGHDQRLILSAFFSCVDLMLPEVTELLVHSVLQERGDVEKFAVETYGFG